MRATVLTPEVAGGPGDRPEIEIEVSNTLDVVDNIALVVRGVDPRAIIADRPSVSLFPGEEATILLTLVVPEALPAGINELIIDVVSVTRPDLNQECRVVVDVEPVDRAELKLVPEIVRAKSKGTVEARVTNTGNTVLEMAMLARDDERHLRFDITPASMLVAPGHVAVVEIVAKGRRPIIGASAYRNVYVNAESEAGLLDDTVSFIQRPWIPRGVLTTALLAMIVAIWALVFVKGLELVLKEDKIPKGAPEGFAMPISYAELLNPDFVRLSEPGADGETGTGGEDGTAAGGEDGAGGTGAGGAGGATAAQANQQDLNATLASLDPMERAALAAVLTSMSGRVVGAESGEVIPRVAVEAHRARPGKVLGSRDTLVQVATTDLQGTFLLSGMLPGEYFYRFAGPGIKVQWFDGDEGTTETVSAATPLRLRAGADDDLETVGINGDPGRIDGIIDTGDLVTTVEVVLRKYIGDVPQEAGIRTETFTSPDADGDGIPDGPIQYAFAGLTTPLEYHLTFRTERFDEQVIVEQVGPGEVLEARPVRLAPGDGTITGTIVFTGGVPTEPVTVTATDGSETFITKTAGPQRNPFGLLATDFSFSGLRSPATYQLRFEVEGFEDVGAAADVKAGESASIIVEMQGQTRRLAGRVIDSSTRSALGDVRIEVLRPTGTSVTFSFPGPPAAFGGTGTPACPTPPANTLPVDRDPSPTGRFNLENLEVGTHAVTFSKAGWQSVTHLLEVATDAEPRFLGLQPDGFIRLTPASGEICGTVFAGTSPRQPLADGVVRLEPANGADDAADTIEVRLADDPAGFFKIAGLEAGDYTLSVIPGDTQQFDECTVRFRVSASDLRSARLIAIEVTLDPAKAPCTVTKRAV